MSTVTFDTLEATRRLRDAGFDEKQAEAVVRVLSDSQNTLVTREYLDLFGHRLLLKIGGMLAAAVGVIIAILRMPPF